MIAIEGMSNMMSQGFLVYVMNKSYMTRYNWYKLYNIFDIWWILQKLKILYTDIFFNIIGFFFFNLTSFTNGKSIYIICQINRRDISYEFDWNDDSDRFYEYDWYDYLISWYFWHL